MRPCSSCTVPLTARHRPVIRSGCSPRSEDSKRLILVPDAGHNGSLRADVWHEIERWIENAVTP